LDPVGAVRVGRRGGGVAGERALEFGELAGEGGGGASEDRVARSLRTAMLLHASPLCRENLEHHNGAQLEDASLDDLLMPNLGYHVETLYDIDCVQRILDYFNVVDGRDWDGVHVADAEDGGGSLGVPHGGTPSTPLSPITMVVQSRTDRVEEEEREEPPPAFAATVMR
jgi:hypothetical protein